MINSIIIISNYLLEDYSGFNRNVNLIFKVLRYKSLCKTIAIWRLFIFIIRQFSMIFVKQQYLCTYKISTLVFHTSRYTNIFHFSTTFFHINGKIYLGLGSNFCQTRYNNIKFNPFSVLRKLGFLMTKSTFLLFLIL